MNPREIAILYYLKGYSGKGGIAARYLFSLLFLTRESGRALIMQNVAGYAVLYLSLEKYDNETVRASQVQLFMEMVAFINRLEKGGALSLFRTDNDKLIAVQDEFDKVRVMGTKVILNGRGDYSPSPQFILDKNGSPIYEGILFRGRQYERIMNAVAGTIAIPGDICSYMNIWSDPIASIPRAGTVNFRGMDTVPKSFRKPGNFRERKRVGLRFAYLVLLLSIAAMNGYMLSRRYGPVVNDDISYEDAFSNICPGTDTAEPTTGMTVADSVRAEAFSPDPAVHFGIDISRYNGEIAALLDSNDSLDFVICKATEGTGYRDPSFTRNWDIVRNKGYLCGAYHFFRFGLSPKIQAEFFWNTLSAAGLPDIPPIVDIEQDSLAPDFLSNLHPDSQLLEFLCEIERLSGRRPIVYTNTAFSNEFLRDSVLSRYPLWLAQYTVSSVPHLPRIWEREGFVMWQQRCDHRLHGIEVDLDMFFGDLSLFMEL